MTERRRWLDRVPRPPRPTIALPVLELPADDESTLPTVVFVPVRCKRCGSSRKRTTGVRWQGRGERRRRVRYHLCQETGCRLRYRSIEIPPRSAE